MSHNVFAKAYVEMRNSKYNPDGSLKEKTATHASTTEAIDTTCPQSCTNQYGTAIIGESKIGECSIG